MRVYVGMAKDATRFERVNFPVVPGYRDLFHVLEDMFLDEWQTRLMEEARVSA